MIHVIATVELAPGTRADFLEEFRQIIAAVRAEAGCLEYVPVIDAQTELPNHARIGPDRLVIIEKWESLAALQAHAVAPHMQAYRPKVKDFVRGMELRVLAPV